MAVDNDVGVGDGFACDYRLAHPSRFHDLQFAFQPVELGISEGGDGCVDEVVTAHIGIDVSGLDASVVLVQPTAGEHPFVIVIDGIPIVPPAKVNLIPPIQRLVVGKQSKRMLHQGDVLLVLCASKPTNLEQVRFGFLVRTGLILLICFVGFVGEDGYLLVEQANLLRQVFRGRGHMVRKSDVLTDLLVKFGVQIVAVHDVPRFQNPVVIKVQDYLRPKGR